MGQIRITVGAAKDRSVDDVFDGIVGKAKRARSQVAAEARASASESNAAWKSAERELARMERERTAEVKKQASERTRAERSAQRDTEREAKRSAKAVADAERESLRDMGRERDKAAADELRRVRSIEAEHKRAAKARDKAISGAVSSGIGLAGRALRYGASVAGDLVRATGVKTDLASHLAANADLETESVNLSNAGYMAGDAKNGKRVDPADLQKFAFEKGNATGYAANDVVGALGAFVAKTGDLKGGMDAFEQMGQLARATGSDIGDMAAAMGDVSNTIGDVPDKANVLNSVMRQIAGQGKLGAVEIKDMAVQMAKVAAAAGSIEGDTAKNIGLMGAFVQEGRQRGGAVGASQAATSVAGMINTFKTPARAAAFKAKGIDVYNAEGQIRDPKAILMEALSKTGSDTLAFKKMFANVSGGRAVEGFHQIYQQSYAATQGTAADKNAAGIAAVNAEFDRLEKATMDQVEVMESFHRSMGTGQAQANVFNNEMQQATQQMQKELTPALIALAPAAVSAAGALGSLAVKILGSEGSKQASTEGAVGAADLDVTATQKQMGSGTVFQEQIDKNKADAKVLQERIAAQRADADARRNTGLAKTAVVGGVGGLVESDVPWWKMAAMPALAVSAAAAGAVKYHKMQQQNAAADDADADKSEEHLKTLNQTQADLLKAVKDGVLKVQIVGSTQGGPAAAPPTGTQVETP